MDEKKKTTQNKSGPLRPEEERATAAECTVCFIWFITGGEKKKTFGACTLALGDLVSLFNILRWPL